MLLLLLLLLPVLLPVLLHVVLHVVLLLPLLVALLLLTSPNLRRLLGEPDLEPAAVEWHALVEHICSTFPSA